MNSYSPFLLGTLACFLLSCSKQTTQQYDIENNALSKQRLISWKQILNPSTPTLINFNLKDETFPENSTVIELASLWEPNTYYCKDGTEVKVEQNFEWFNNTNSSQKQLRINHKRWIKKQGGDDSQTIVNISTPDSIIIYSPLPESCAEIMYLYYDDLEITWNADLSNENGVVILTNWNGVRINGSNSIIEPLWQADLVHDTGSAILNNHLFDDIPDGAYMSIYLIRANIIEVLQGNTPVNLEDVDWASIIEEYPELEMNVCTIALGVMTKLSFVLVRDL